jgi:hypothetical protein
MYLFDIGVSCGFALVRRIIGYLAPQFNRASLPRQVRVAFPPPGRIGVQQRHPAPNTYSDD